jgi:hypothetical protein
MAEWCCKKAQEMLEERRLMVAVGTKTFWLGHEILFCPWCGAHRFEKTYPQTRPMAVPALAGKEKDPDGR